MIHPERGMFMVYYARDTMWAWYVHGIHTNDTP